MKLLCKDGKYRQFIPSTTASSHLKITLTRLDKAYCNHCKTPFREVPLKEQEVELRNHICSGGTTKTDKE